MSFENGEQVGEYRIVRANVAHGASGILHEAVDRAGRRIALKVLDRERLLANYTKRLQDEGSPVESIPAEAAALYAAAVTQLKNEYATLIGLRHPNIAEVYQLGAYEGQLYMATEFIEGSPLFNYCLKRLPQEMIPLFCQALEGLAFIHQRGLLHLDIKSENLLVQEVDGQPVVKLVDFGLARTPAAYTGTIVGSVPYMAPEIILGQTDRVDGRADLFSFGVLMFLCVTWRQFPFPLRRGFRGDWKALQALVAAETLPHPPSHYRSRHLPTLFDDLLPRLLAHEPGQRGYRTARAVINALVTQQPDVFVETQPVLAAYLRPPGNQHIGREPEQQRVREALDHLIAGRQPVPALAIIAGVEGMGKSHILATVAHWAEANAERIAIHRLQLPAPDEGMAAWVAQVETSLEGPQPVLLLLDDLDETFSPHPPPQGEEEIAPQSSSPPLRGGDKGEGEHMQLLSLLRALTAPDPDATLRPFPPVLIYATINPDRGPLAAVCAALGLSVPSPLGDGVARTCSPPLRGGDAGEGAGMRGTVTLLELSPFSRAELIAYLHATPALHTRDLPPAWVDHVLAVTDGIPAEVVAQLEEMDSRGLLFGLDGAIIVAAAEEPAVERSLHVHVAQPTQARLLARYQQTPAPVQAALQCLATWYWQPVAGPMAPATLTALCPVPIGRPVWEELRHSGFIASAGVKEPVPQESPAPPAVTFAHPLAAPVIYAALPPATRRQWHHRLAEQVGRHERAGSRPRSASNEGDVSRPDKDAPNRQERREPSPLPRLPFWFHTGMAGTDSTAAACLLRCARHALQQGKVSFAHVCCTEALARCAHARPALRAHTHALLIDVLYHAGRPNAAEKLFQEAIAGGMEQQLSRPWFLQLSIRGITLAIAALRFDDARQRLVSAQQLVGENESTPMTLQLANLAVRLDYREALSKVTEVPSPLFACAEERLRALAARETLLPQANRPRMRNNDLGRFLVMAGRYGEGVPILAELRRRHVQACDLFGQLKTTLDLAEACRLAHAYREAETHAQHALQLARQTRQGKWVLQAHRLLANGYYDTDRYGKALNAYRCALAALACLPSSAEFAQVRLEIWLQLGQCYKELRKPNAARTFFEAVLVANPPPEYGVITHIRLAELACERAEYERTNTRLATATELLNLLPRDRTLPYAFRIAILAATAAYKQGDPSTAATHLATAEALAAHSAARQQEIATFKATFTI